MKLSQLLLTSSILILNLTGCNKIPYMDDGSVSSIIETRIDKEVAWNRTCDRDQVQYVLCEMIQNELTADSAIQIALLNNPKIQATFEELGIAQADLVEAGLLSNPSFEIEIRYPSVSWLKTNIEYLITSSLLDLFLIPLRTRLARTEFEQTKLKVSNAILDLAFEVRETFYELIAEIKNRRYLGSIVDLTNIISDISSKQMTIGNINPLEFQLTEARLLDAELEFFRSQAEIIRMKEKLNRLLGLSEAICLILPASLPNTDYCGFDLCALESIALEERLDLQVARFEIARLGQMLGLKDWWTYTNLKGGLAGEREPDGFNLIGPGFSGELPIFNYGQAARMRLFAQLRQAQDRLAELEVKVLSEVREAYKLLMNYLEMVNDYRYKLLPLQGKILASSEELYNVMGLGVDKLLEYKRQEVIAHQNYSESLKRYSIARVELDRALGGYLYKLISQIECVEGAAQ